MNWEKLHKRAELMKAQYIPGTRVRLVYMNDPQAPPVGTLGTVIGVDDIGTVRVRWDNGSGLGITEEDRCEIIEIGVKE